MLERWEHILLNISKWWSLIESAVFNLDLCGVVELSLWQVLCGFGSSWTTHSHTASACSDGQKKKYLRLSLSNRDLFLTVLGLGSPRSRCWPSQFPEKGSLLGWQVTTVSVSSQGGDRECSGLSSPSDKATNTITGVPPSWPHLNPIITTSRDHHIGGWGFNKCIFEMITNFQSVTHTL